MAGRQRKLHKAFLRYHDPNNWPLLREVLKTMGRADLIGNGKKQLIPAWQPATSRVSGATAPVRGLQEKTGKFQTALPNRASASGLRVNRPNR